MNRRMIVDNDLLSIQQARIIAENASAARKQLADFSQDRLDGVVETIAAALTPHLEKLARLSAEETGSGRWQDKLAKNRFVCNRVLQALRSERCVGVIGENSAHGLVEIGIPYGVIVALCPLTSPVSTTIFKTLLAIKSGNAILFSPHPGAAQVISRTLEIVVDAAQASGLPQGAIAFLEPVSKAGTHELLHHPAVSMLLMTGVPGMLAEARRTGKPLIYGGTGNGPAFIEQSADLLQAVRDIVLSKSFDLGMAPGAEQSIVVETSVAGEVRRLLAEHGGYFMNDQESRQLANQLFCPDGRHRKGMIGQSAEVLARRAGFTIPTGTRLLIADRRYVTHRDPYSRELLAPVLALYEEDDWRNACEKCIELLLFEHNAHTMVIHSGDEEVIRQFALKKPVGRLLVNTPAVFGAMGATTQLSPSLTLGGGSAGHGITAANVSPMHLIYRRTVGRGIRRLERLDSEVPASTASLYHTTRTPHPTEPDKAQALRMLLTEVIRTLEAEPEKKRIP